MSLIRNTKRFVKKNGSFMLTCLGAIGVVGTAVMACQDTPRALSLLKEAEEEKTCPLTTWEKIITVTPVYIPSVVIGVSTIACIFGANALNKRQQAVLTSAYVMLDQSFKEYKKKVVDLYGKDGEQHIHTELARDRLKNIELSTEEEGELFYDEYSNRYFNLTMDDFAKAIYHLNRNFILNEYVSLNDLYIFLRLKPTDLGEMLGWSLEAGGLWYGYQWIEFELNKVVMEDGLECNVIMMPVEPTPDYMCF